VGINLRRVYKYLRNLRGKKLVFRRNVPASYQLTEKGKTVAQFLEKVASVR
jgi:predicted transcriptional regulator